MKKIKLFLTSSLQELEHDLKDLGAFVGDLNDRYASHNVYFQLNISGEGDFAEDVEAAENSELFYIIFHDEPQDRAKAEFEAAYAAFHEKKTPKIITYYKQLDSNHPEDTALAFMDKLRNELGHFNSKYTHMDTVKLNVILQLKSLGLEHIKVDVEGSSLVVDGKEMMTLDNIPIVFNNKNLSAMKAEYAGIEKEFWALKERVRKNPDDEEALSAYLHISGQKNKINEAMHSLQKDILAMETSFLEKSGSSYISPRQVQARFCLEDGDIEGAKQILAEDELEREEVQAMELLDETKKKVQSLVGDWLQRVDVLKLDIKNPERFTEIEHSYEKAIKLEKDGGLERESLERYAYYFLDQHNYEKSINYAQLYLNWLESEGKEGRENTSIFNLIALCHTNLLHFKEAEEIYKKALAIYERLAVENPVAFEPELAWIGGFLANLYVTTRRYSEAEELYKKELAIYERLASESPAAFESRLALSCDQLADLYETTQRYSEAEELYKKELAIYERLASESPADFKQEDLAESCDNLASLYYRTERYTEAEELYKKVLAVHERLAGENLTVFERALVTTYNDLAVFYYNTKRYKEAEELYKKVLAIYERLTKENPETYEPAFMRSYNCLASFYYKTERYTEAEEQYKKALAVCERLAKENPVTNVPSLVTSYSGLANLYYTTERYTEAEELYKKALAICEQLVKENPVFNEPALATIYNNLAGLYCKTKRYTEAEEFYNKAMAIREYLAKVNPSESEPDLLRTYKDLSNLYIVTGRLTEFEELYEKSLPIRERLGYKETLTEDEINQLLAAINGLDENEQGAI